jgi:hypothetical protein
LGVQERKKASVRCEHDFYLTAFDEQKYHSLDSMASLVKKASNVDAFYFKSQKFYHHLKTLLPTGDLTVLLP